jgi:hypothetical protein
MSATATSSREELLMKVRERLTTRLAAVEKEMKILQSKLDEAMTERIELQTKLKILDEEMIEEQLRTGLE